MIKRISSFILCVLLLLSCLYIPVDAHSSFTDVGLKSQYYDAVKFLANNGFETQDRKFHPDEKISVPSFMAMLLNITVGKRGNEFCERFFKDICLGEDTIQTSINYVDCAKFFMLQPLECSSAVDHSFMNNKIDFMSVWISAFISAQILPMDASLYNSEQYGFDKYVNAEFLNIANERYQCTFVDYIAAAYMTNISPTGTNPCEVPTRGEVANILYKLFTNNFDNQPLPQNISTIKIKIDCKKAKINYSYTMRGLTKIPKKYIDMFVYDKWKIVVSDDIRKYYWKYRDQNICGMINYSLKTIYIGNNRSSGAIIEHAIIHEFGHYVHIKENIDMSIIYNKELNEIVYLTGQYAATNEDEAFAEIFAYYIQNKNNTNMMQENAPLSYEMISKLV